MKKPRFVILAALLALIVPGTSLTAGTKEDQQVRQAAAIMQRFRSMPEKDIPRHVMRDARGLAILTVTKGGFIWSGKGGQGVVVARTKNGWSGPSFIRTGGIGFGAQIGAEVTEYVLVLNTPEAVQAFAKNANVTLGGALSVAAGPVGRDAEAGLTPRRRSTATAAAKGCLPVPPSRARWSAPTRRRISATTVPTSAPAPSSTARATSQPVPASCSAACDHRLIQV